STYHEIEPNNTALSANDVSVPTTGILTATANDWLAIQGQISTSTDRDIFRFNLTTKSGGFFDVDSRDTGLSTTLDAVLDVYDSSGATLLGSNDDGSDLDGFTPPVSAQAQATSSDRSLYLDLGPGTYVVRMTSFQSASTGSYELRMLTESTYAASAPFLTSH